MTSSLFDSAYLLVSLTVGKTSLSTLNSHVSLTVSSFFSSPLYVICTHLCSVSFFLYTRYFKTTSYTHPLLWSYPTWCCYTPPQQLNFCYLHFYFMSFSQRPTLADPFTFNTAHIFITRHFRRSFHFVQPSLTVCVITNVAF